jgi:hypothetical protein
MGRQRRTQVRVATGLVALLAWCRTAAQDVDPTSDPFVQPHTNTPVSGYTLVWSDEFNGSAVDTAKWDFRTGVRLWSTQLPANNSVSNGLYLLHVKRETVGSTDYTAGGIISKSLHRYGYYETRMRVPPGRGWHTSFWMMRYNSTSNEPVSIELDALENDSVNLLKYSVNTHRHKPTPHVTFGTKTVNTPSLNTDFHVIGCDFTPTQVRYFFDGAVVQTVNATQFPHNDLNIWLTSVAASLGGTTNVDDSLLPNLAEYDYARFFVPSPTGTVSIVTPHSGGVRLADTNTALRVKALATSSDSHFVPAVMWSTLSGPGTVTFASATNSDTTARFSAPGNYVLQCQAVVWRSTNAGQVAMAVAEPLAVSLRQGVAGYTHAATFIRGDSVSWNSGGRDQFIVGRWGGQGLRPLLSFDLAGFDPAATIRSATLDLWTDATAGVGSVGPLELHKLNATPVEGTGDGSSASHGAGTGATWLSRTGGTNTTDLWAVAGGDFDANVLSSVSGYDATATGVQRTFPSTSNFVAVAQSALDAEVPLNLLVISPTTEAAANNYISRVSSDDSAVLERRPLLTLTLEGHLAPTVSTSGGLVGLPGVPAPLGGSVSNATGSAWTKLNGPGTVGFADPGSPGTTASFGQPGSYVLRLSASNALAEASTQLAVTVLASAPRLVAAATTNDEFMIRISGPSGVSYTVQGSTNLAAWTSLFTTNPAAMPFTWSEAGSPSYQRRFYRVLLRP